MAVRRPRGSRSLAYADDAEERNGSRRDRERQRERRAVLPPPVVEPMRRYSQPPPPPRSTRSTAAKIFGWILLALVIVVTGLAGGLYLYCHETLNAIAPHSAAVKKSQKDLAPVPAPSEPAVALVIGYDARAGSRGLRPRRLALGHDHADPRGPHDEHAVPALVPARPPGADLLRPDDGDQDRPHQLRVVELPEQRATGRSTPSRS